MPLRTRPLLLLALALLLVWGSVALLLLAGPRPTRPNAEAARALPTMPTPTPGPAPTRVLPLLAGGDASLANWRGKGIILNFWATWCYPCRMEMPALADAYQAHKEEVVVVGVNYEEDAARARAFVEEYAIPFPILVDESGALGRDFDVRGMPTTFFIDAEGQVVGMHIGPLEPTDLERIVAQLRPAAP